MITDLATKSWLRSSAKFVYGWDSQGMVIVSSIYGALDVMEVETSLLESIRMKNG